MYPMPTYKNNSEEIVVIKDETGNQAEIHPGRTGSIVGFAPPSLELELIDAYPPVNSSVLFGQQVIDATIDVPYYDGFILVSIFPNSESGKNVEFKIWPNDFYGRDERYVTLEAGGALGLGASWNEIRRVSIKGKAYVIIEKELPGVNMSAQKIKGEPLFQFEGSEQIFDLPYYEGFAKLSFEANDKAAFVLADDTAVISIDGTTTFTVISPWNLVGKIRITGKGTISASRVEFGEGKSTKLVRGSMSYGHSSELSELLKKAQASRDNQ
jgi:hypothetical protein